MVLHGSDAPIDFCTLGMFIIDEILFKPPTAPVNNILGGAGTYSAIGARIFSPSPLSRSVGWIVDCGSDFPKELRKTIAEWDTGCLIRETPHRLTTRGWNHYGDDEYRAFRYTTPKLRLDHNSLTPKLLLSKTFHLICSPLRCIKLVSEILSRRTKLRQAGSLSKPIFIWEPVPDLCTKDELDNACKALKYIHVVSPNHTELASFFGKSASREGEIDKEVLADCSDQWLKAGVGSQGEGAVVVRSGKEGCYVASREKSRWMPAYHQSQDKVVDPTGGGNAFLGGLAIALSRAQFFPSLHNIEHAVAHGSIAASFAIEQIGMPKLTIMAEEELWNGESAESRLKVYLGRLDRYIQS